MPRYVLQRPLPMGLKPRQRSYRLLDSGHIEPFADVDFPSGGAKPQRRGTLTRLYEHLPPSMS